MKLSPTEWTPFLSAYLTGGWKQDELALDAVEVMPDRIVGRIRVEEQFMPADGVFHLAVPAAFIWIAQLAIIYGCWEHKLLAKPGEVYLRSITIDCRRTVSKIDAIEIKLDLTKKRYLGKTVYYVGRFDIDNGAFVGTASFILPLPATVQAMRESD